MMDHFRRLQTFSDELVERLEVAGLNDLQDDVPAALDDPDDRGLVVVLLQ